MKKIYTLVAGIVLTGSIFGQGIMTHASDGPRHKAVVTPGSTLHRANTSSRAAGPFTFYVEPVGDVMTTKGLNLNATTGTSDEDWYVNAVYMDSTTQISSPSSTRYIHDIMLGSVLDPKSTFLQVSGDPLCTNADSYTLDSIWVQGSYVKKTSNTDTLYTWVVWGDSLTGSGALTKRLNADIWIAPIANWRYEIIAPTVAGFGAAQGNIIHSAAGASNMVLIKRVLTDADSVSGGGYSRAIGIAMPSTITIPAGNIVSAFYTFVPGGAHTTGDCSYAFTGGSLTQNVNGFAGIVWGQTTPAVAAVTDYVDQQVDPAGWNMGTSYYYKQRYGTYPAAYDNSLWGDLTTGTVIFYKISGTSHLGVNELSSSNTSLLQNQPNPARGTTTFRYELSQSASNVAIEITDVTGKKVALISKGKQAPGKYSVDFDTNGLDAGVYFYTLKSDNGQVTRKMSVTK
jgi:hypothetical protein